MQKVEVQLEDDLAGGPADETVHFGVDGRAYELDLNARHAADLRHRLAPFVGRAKLVPRRRFKATARTAASRARSGQIRDWAEQQGLTVSARGRLPATVIQEYETAHGDSGLRASGSQPPGVNPPRGEPAALHAAAPATPGDVTLCAQKTEHEPGYARTENSHAGTNKASRHSRCS